MAMQYNKDYKHVLWDFYSRDDLSYIAYTVDIVA
jgi:hypothetical protein